MKRIHFIAIGGAIMHQLALALKRQGNIVTGSDDEINDPAKTNLMIAGILPEKSGWFPEKITIEIDGIVLGMHAKIDNPELLKAKEIGLPILSFPEFIYQISTNKKRVVVAGSHGKTTITSMIMHVLNYQGIDFDYLVGAKVEGFEQSVKLSDAPLIIIEGDEYPASVEEKRPKIFFYHPNISVLTGIAWDHINVFPTYDNYFEQFVSYLKNMEQGSLLLYNGEDIEVCRALKTANGNFAQVAYGTPKFHYEDAVPVLETPFGKIYLSVFGKHNVQNVAGALKVCIELGVPEKVCYEAISSFKGAARRLEKIKETKDLLVYRDFAHAPSKLNATLKAVREAYPNHRLIACFELHTYSSLSEQFLSQYSNCMNASDEAIVYFSSHALSLKGLPKLNPDIVFNHFQRKDLTVIDNKEWLFSTVKNKINGDKSRPVFLLLMSSGTFDGIDWQMV